MTLAGVDHSALAIADPLGSRLPGVARQRLVGDAKTAVLFFEGQTKKVLVEGGSGTSHVFQPPEVHVQFVVVPSARRCQRPRRARYAG